ncbi:MAG: MaoC/PaaZ C-terminal domain-containing protein [Chloroflexi bacterium]|nr:MaoC/PaaZ C-terminal domain-containing protein [Chloroflexota bacterium]
MAEQVYWDDVQDGAELPPVVKNPTTQQLVKYAGASGDYYQIHYDKDFAMNNDLENVILHGALKNAFLGHLMTKWMGDQGDLKRLACQYRGMDIPGTPVTAKGVVTRKYQEQGANLVDCEIWLENEKGEKTTPGSATVALPLR